MRRIALFTVFFCIMIASLSVSQSASALGVGASPDRIDIECINPGDSHSEVIYVVNTGDTPERIVIKPEAFENITAISPDEVILSPKESAEVNLTISVPHGFEKGSYAGSLLITAFEVGSNRPSGLNIGASVRIPVLFTVKTPVILRIAIALGTIGVALTAIFFVWYRKRA